MINTGDLTDTDAKSVGRSTFYALNSLLPPRLLHYELVATIDGMTETYSDDPDNFNPINTAGSPIQLLLQGAVLNLVDLSPIEEPGPWVESVAELALSNPTGFRFIVFFDSALAGSMSIDSFKLIYET